MSAVAISVWTEPLAESNCYIIYEHKERHGNEVAPCAVIDPNDPMGPLSVLEQKYLRPEWILLTHEHCDHTAGLEPMRERFPDAQVMASEQCNIGMQNARLNMSRMMEVYLTFFGKSGVSYAPFVCRPADKTYNEACTLDWRGHMFRFVLLPGHTAGSVGIFLDDDIFFSGDYLLPGREVILRLPGGSEKDYREITEPFLATLPVGIHIYPGHGKDYRIAVPVDSCEGLIPV